MCMCGGCAQCMSDQGYGEYDESAERAIALADMEECHAHAMEERSYRILMLLGEDFSPQSGPHLTTANG